MAAASDSNDASDIFWPGYVDAVTNLAINLLFVIAVMSIVVISTIMQISKMKPEIFTPVENAVTSKPRAIDLTDKTGNPESNPSQQVSPVNQSTQSIEKVLQEKAKSEEKLAEQTKQLIKLQKEVEALKKSQQSTTASQNSKGGTADINAKADIVNATENRLRNNLGQNQMLQVGSGGVLVIFDQDVVRLSEAEIKDLLDKLKSLMLVENSGFEIRVNTPKGFSESSRIAYYRVNEIRNILIKNGIKPSNISMRVIESESQSANNARVLVKPAFP